MQSIVETLSNLNTRIKHLEARDGNGFDQARRARNQQSRHTARNVELMAHTIVSFLRVRDSEAANLTHATAGIHANRQNIRADRLYRGLWHYICTAIESDFAGPHTPVTNRATPDQIKSFKSIMVQAFEANHFKYIENGEPSEFAPYSRIVDFLPEMRIIDAQKAFVNRFLDSVHFTHISPTVIARDVSLTCRQYIHDHKDEIPRLYDLWMHVCNEIKEIFKEQYPNMGEKYEQQMKHFRRLVADAFMQNGFAFEKYNIAILYDFNEHSTLRIRNADDPQIIRQDDATNDEASDDD